MNFDDFKRIAEAVRHVIPSEMRRLGGREYHDIMNAISDAGFPFRPNWDLVDALRDWVRATKPLDRMLLLDAAYLNFFGHPPSLDTSLESPKLAIAA